MTENLTIAFDVDGVLRDLTGYAVEMLGPDQKSYLAGQSIEEFTYFDKFMELFPNKAEWRASMEKINAWKDAPAIEDMIGIWHRLVEAGYNCIIVTSNSYPRGQMDTIDWLHWNLSGGKVEVPLDIHFTNDKLTVRCDAIIEDSPRNCKKAAEVSRMAFLVERPWTNTEEPRNRIEKNTDRFKILPPDDEALPVIIEGLGWLKGFSEGFKTRC